MLAERVANMLGAYARSASRAPATSTARFARRWSGCGCRRRTPSSEPFRAGPATRRNSSESASRPSRRRAETAAQKASRTLPLNPLREAVAAQRPVIWA